MDEDRRMEGRADRVIRRLINNGQVDEVLELIEAISSNDGRDISVGFRVALMAQGFEAEAFRCGEVKLFFHKQGFLIQIDPIKDEDLEWYDHKTPEQQQAFDQATVWVLRAGNIDAYIDANGDIGARGKIVPTKDEDVEQIIGQFKAEIDERFPDTPPKREGKWW